MIPVRAFFALACLAASAAFAQPVQPVLDAAKARKAEFIETMRELVEIESGSSDREGLDRIAEVIAARLKALGGEVEVIETPEDEIVRREGAPEKPGRMVRATFRGKGDKDILLLAHMDTVYPRGMLARQPFRIDGDRAYGAGIADEKQGIALVLHTMAMLRELGYQGYRRITVLVNGDEEVGSPASQKLITQLGSEHHATFSFEASWTTSDRVSLVTSGGGSATLRVTGRASHAANWPQTGVNALYELAHQINQMRDLSEPDGGLRVNWTLAKAGVVSNMITPEAEATADIRVRRVEEFELAERKMRERVKNQLLPQARVELTVHRGRPPLEATEASRALAAHARGIYREIGRDLVINDNRPAGGTDAAYAALRAKGPVIEHWGIAGFGAHSTNAEYVVLSTIEPRLYLVARTIMDISEGKVR